MINMQKLENQENALLQLLNIAIQKNTKTYNTKNITYNLSGNNLMISISDKKNIPNLV